MTTIDGEGGEGGEDGEDGEDEDERVTTLTTMTRVSAALPTYMEVSFVNDPMSFGSDPVRPELESDLRINEVSYSGEEDNEISATHSAVMSPTASHKTLPVVFGQLLGSVTLPSAANKLDDDALSDTASLK